MQNENVVEEKKELKKFMNKIIVLLALLITSSIFLGLSTDFLNTTKSLFVDFFTLSFALLFIAIGLMAFWDFD